MPSDQHPSQARSGLSDNAVLLHLMLSLRSRLVADFKIYPHFPTNAGSTPAVTEHCFFKILENPNDLKSAAR